VDFIHSTPELSERNCCDGREMKLASPLDGMRLLRKALRLVLTSGFHYKWLDTSLYLIVTNRGVKTGTFPSWNLELTPKISIL